MDKADTSAAPVGASSPIPIPIDQPQRSNSQQGSIGNGSGSHRTPGHIPTHRQSFAENLRNPPPSPRAQRHLSLSQSAIQELLLKNPSSKQPNPLFANRDWRDVAVGELVTQDDVKWADLDTSVEEATMVRELCNKTRTNPRRGSNKPSQLIMILFAVTSEELSSKCCPRPGEEHRQYARIYL